MKATFSKDVTFSSNVLVGTEWKLQPVTKPALFYELNQADPDQRDITFQILSLWDWDSKKKILRADPKLLVSLMEDIVDVLLVVKDPNNAETKDLNTLNIQDVIELKNDNFGMGLLAKWYVQNKIAPFFLNLNLSYSGS